MSKENRNKQIPTMKANKYAKGLFNWTFLTIVVVGLVLVNIVSSFLYKRFDMTVDQRYSLAQGTIDFLSDTTNLRSRVVLTIYLDGNMPSEMKHFRNAIEDKLKEFREYAGDKIEFQFKDPNIGTETEQNDLHQKLYRQGKGLIPMELMYQKDGSQSQIMLWPGAIINFEGEDRNAVQFMPGTPAGRPYQMDGITEMIQNSLNNLEYILLSSIRRATQLNRQKIGFLQGHGELSEPQTIRARTLIAPYFSTTDVTINGRLDALEGIDGLIIAGPKVPLPEKDLFIIDQFLLKGGRLVCLLDALDLPEDSLKTKGMTHTTRRSTGLEKMLFDYGLKLNDNFVIDARCAPIVTPFAKQSLLPWFFHILATPTSHPIARNLEPVSLKYANEIQFVEDDRYRLSPILTSSTNSTVTGMAPLVSLGMPLNYGSNPELVPNPEDESNKRCLAALSEGKYVSHFKNRIIEDYTNNPASVFLAEGIKESKVMLIGNSSFIQNSYDSMPNKTTGVMMYRPIEINELRMDPALTELKIPMFFGNQEFFQNMIDYVMGENSVVDIRSKQIDIHELDNKKIQENAGFYKLLNMTLPSILVLIFAYIMSFIRRKKYSY